MEEIVSNHTASTATASIETLQTAVHLAALISHLDSSYKRVS